MKKWKIELWLTLGMILLIPATYLCFGAFAQIMALPVIALLLGLFAGNRFGFLPLYSIFATLVYFILFSMVARTVELSSLYLVLGTLLLPSYLGLVIGVALEKVLKGAYPYLLPVFGLSSFLILIFLMLTYGHEGTLLYYWVFYLALPLVILLANAWIGYLYGKRWGFSLSSYLVYFLLYGFSRGQYFTLLGLLYLLISLLALYLGQMVKIS